MFLPLPLRSHVGFFRHFNIPPGIDFQSLVGSPDYLVALVPVPLYPLCQLDMNLVERIIDLSPDPVLLFVLLLLRPAVGCFFFSFFFVGILAALGVPSVQDSVDWPVAPLLRAA